MPKRTPRVLAMTAIACGALPGAGASPPLFTEEPYAEAKASAAEAGKLFVVDATAEWCGPCKQMDKRVWVDESVVSWFAEHAVAAQVDVDEQPELAADLGIRAMPTIIAFKGAEEVDRIVGYQSPEELLSWLEGAEAGRSRLDELRARIEADEAEGIFDVEARYELARGLALAGRGREAVDHYVWLWRHALEHDPNFVGVRVSFMAGDMENLVRGGHGREAFTRLRDETEARLRSEDRTWEDLGDWLALNEIIGDDAATLAWVDRNIGDEAGRRTIRRYWRFSVAPLLIEHERWQAYGTLLEAPVERIRAEHGQIDALASVMPEADQTRRAQMREQAQRRFRQKAANIHAGLLAAGRDDEAWRAARVALDLDGAAPTAEAIVSGAIGARQARARHRSLLDASLHGALLERLDAELGGG